MKATTLIFVAFCIIAVVAGEPYEREGSEYEEGSESSSSSSSMPIQASSSPSSPSSSMRSYKFFNPASIVTAPVLATAPVFATAPVVLSGDVSKPLFDTQAILARLEASPLPLPTEMIQHPALGAKTAKLIAQNMPPQPQAIVHPFSLPVVASELDEDTKWNFVTQPITTKQRTLGRIELAPIMQPYTVSSTSYSQEAIKQPISEPVFQPYLQRYIQQAHPEVQPVLQRVVQPVVHRELHPFLQTHTEQAPDAPTVVKPTQAIVNTNMAIRGSDMTPLPISKTVSNA